MAAPHTLAMMDAVILCGGRGTRLGALTAKTPKPLLLVGDSPFLLRRLLSLREQGILRIILAAQFLAEQFREFQRQHAKMFPGLTVVEEPEPLGTGGALRFAATHVRSHDLIAMNGDSWVDQPLAPVVAHHRAHGRAFTMMLVRASRIEGNVRNKGIVCLGPEDNITGFRTTEAEAGWVNAGVYVAETAFLRGWPAGSYDLEQHFLSLVPPSRSRVLYSEERLIDIGTPDVYERAQLVLNESHGASA